MPARPMTTWHGCCGRSGRRPASCIASAAVARSPKPRAIVRDVPLERLLVETDAPYLAPVPYRGRRNEPAYVAATATAVAILKGVEPEALAAATTDNFFRLFAKASRPLVATL